MFRCEPERAPLKVALLLSGGVDSSLALKLLLAAGHHVTAFYLQVFSCCLDLQLHAAEHKAILSTCISL